MHRFEPEFVPTSSRTQVKLDGIFVVTLDETKHCTIVREWWHREEIHNERTSY